MRVNVQRDHLKISVERPSEKPTMAMRRAAMAIAARRAIGREAPDKIRGELRTQDDSTRSVKTFTYGVGKFGGLIPVSRENVLHQSDHSTTRVEVALDRHGKAVSGKGSITTVNPRTGRSMRTVVEGKTVDGEFAIDPASERSFYRERMGEPVQRDKRWTRDPMAGAVLEMNVASHGTPLKK
jgi:hypothetical protein